MLDYDKKFLLESLGNLTFDGSSIRGFTPQHESDLRLEVDWSSIRYFPADVIGAGKVIFFASVLNADRTPYHSDFRGMLKSYTKNLKIKQGMTAYAASEIEGFLVEGQNAEQRYGENGFKLISTGGYYHSLPMDTLRQFIDKSAEAQRALGFKNEKDHPEVAPSQFEMNFSYADVVRAADQCAAVQTDLSPSGSIHGAHGHVPSEAIRWDQWFRHAHQLLLEQEWQEYLLRCEGERWPFRCGMGLHSQTPESCVRDLSSV